MIAPHHLNLSLQRSYTTKFSLLNVAEASVETKNGEEPSSLNSSTNLSSFLKFNPISSVKARHAQTIKLPRKTDSDVKVQSLITSYLEFGDIQSAAMVFFMFFPENYLHWNSFLEDCSNCNSGGDPHEILTVFVRLHGMGVNFGSQTLATVLKLCANLGNPWLGMEIHVCLIKKGFNLDVYSKCALMNFYGRCWGLHIADKAFTETSNSTSMLWNEAILVALRNEKWFQGLEFFQQMLLMFPRASNSLTLAKVLQACGKIRALDEGKQIHCYILRNTIGSNILLCNSLINMYVKNESLAQAKAVFDQMANRDLSTWNSIISGFMVHGCLNEALRLFQQMQQSSDAEPDVVTWNSLLSGHLHHGSCRDVLATLSNMQIAGFKPNSRSINPVLQVVSELSLLIPGKTVHCYVVRNGLDSDLHVVTSLLDMYVKNNDLKSAQAVFDGMMEKNIFAWNSLISGYTYKGDFQKALSLLKQMDREGICPDLVTYNSLISGYSVAGQIDKAFTIIREIKNSSLTPNVVSWTALISGCSQNGYYTEALQFAYQMQTEGIKPNSATTASILKACAGLSLLQKGKEVHSFSFRNGYTEDEYLYTALIDMYSKCGDIENAYKVFQRTHNRTLASWNAIMMGLSAYGRGKAVASLFHRMQQERIQLDAITMTALLSGCKHSGLIDDGWNYFDNMEADYGITPTVQHYSCMVDLLGRAGYLDEAWDFIRAMPVEPDAAVWGAFLGSCRIHNNIPLAEVAARELFKLEPSNSANYVLLMNMYAAAKRWNDVDGIQNLLNSRPVSLGNVWSWIEINKKVHVFSAAGNQQVDGELYFELYHLMSEIKKAGYLPDTKCVHKNIEEEEKEKVLLSHTEKLAITYGLTKTKPDTPIRVINNTSICADCHMFARYISFVKQRQVILKDGMRYHYMIKGKCSCSNCPL